LRCSHPGPLAGRLLFPGETGRCRPSACQSDDTLQGYFPRRFLGTGRVLLNAEYRARLGGFTFLRLWYLQFDGAVFAGAGRVFMDRDDLGRRFAPGDAARLRFAGGPGLRIALSQALVARIDVGFSEEEAGIVYLAFGHAF